MATLRATCALFPDPLLGEAATTLRVVTFCLELGMSSNIILEGDYAGSSGYQKQ